MSRKLGAVQRAVLDYAAHCMEVEGEGAPWALFSKHREPCMAEWPDEYPGNARSAYLAALQLVERGLLRVVGDSFGPTAEGYAALPSTGDKENDA